MSGEGLDLKSQICMLSQAEYHAINQQVISIVHREIDSLGLRIKHSKFDNLAQWETAKKVHDSLLTLVTDLQRKQIEDLLKVNELLSVSAKMAIRNVVLNEISRKKALSPESLKQSLEGWRAYEHKGNSVDKRPRNLDGSLDMRFKENKNR